MNILGYVSAILIIFCISLNFMFKSHVNTYQIQKSIEGNYLANQKAQKKLEELTYDGFEGTPTFTTTKKKKKKTSKQVYKKPNDKIYPCGLLSIYSLCTEGKADEYTYKLFGKLIKMLYPDIFFEKNSEYKFIDQLIKIVQKIPQEEIILETLTFKNPNLQEIWYKMLKRTKNYDFDKKIGRPSILEFITISDYPGTICINKTSKEILTCLFGEKATNKIILKKNITKVDLDNILYDFKYWDHINFSHSQHDKNAIAIICKDEASMITIKKTR